MKSNYIVLIIIGFIVMGVIINVMNHPEPEAPSPAPAPAPSPQAAAQEEIAPEDPAPNLVTLSDQPAPADIPQDGMAYRKTFVTRGDDHVQNVFYKDGKEVARQTISNDGRIDQAGEIPEGRVKFIDEYNHAKGEENYLGGKKFGESKTYYPGGALKTEEKYENDKLIYTKDYYRTGTLRFSANYQDARNFGDNKEVGIGKLYYPDGTLKYEWSLIRSDPTGFKKSYNTDGSLRAETYIDETGKVIPNPFAVMGP